MNQRTFLRIRKELIVKIAASIVPLTLLLTIFCYSTVWVNINNSNMLQVQQNPYFKIFKYFSFYWFIFSLSTFFITLFVKTLKNRSTSLLKAYFQNQLKVLNLKISSYNIVLILHIFFLILSNTFFILIDFKVIKFDGEFFLFMAIILFTVETIFVLIHIFKENERVKLRNNYYITIDVKFPIIRRKAYNLIEIFIKSETIRLSNKESKKSLLSSISKKNWLKLHRTFYQKKKFSKYAVKICAFCTCQDFQNKILDLAISLREWDIKSKLVNA